VGGKVFIVYPPVTPVYRFSCHRPSSQCSKERFACKIIGVGSGFGWHDIDLVPSLDLQV